MSDRSTSIQRFINASPTAVYLALIDAEDVRAWMVPDNMSSVVHEFDPTVGGSIRISLTYEDRDAVGKSAAHTDTWHGQFVELVPGERVVQVQEFETDDPSMQGEMTARYELRPEAGGTWLAATHSNLPAGLSEADNETGWTMSLAKLAALVESREER